MSHEEWEHGSITLPRDQFTKVRRTFVDRHNELEQRAYDAAKKAWDEATPKQKKDSRYLEERIDKLTEPKTRLAGSQYWSMYRETVNDGEYEVQSRAYDLLMLHRYNTDPRPPQKKNMDTLPASATSFDGGEYGGSVYFNAEKGTVTWETGGNHASETARSTWTDDLLHKALSDVKWTRGSGGVIHQGSETHTTRPMRGYGPAGLAEAPDVTERYRRSDGTMLPQSELDAAIAKQKRAQAKQLRSRAQALRDEADAIEQGRKRDGRYDFKRGSAPGIRL